jgi:outer membrane protein
MIGFHSVPRTSPAHAPSRFSFHASRLGCAAALLMLSVPAWAATPLDAEENADENVLLMGAGVAVSPKYSGSDEKRVTAALGIDYSMANGFFASTMRGVGWGSSIGRFNYSAALSYRAEREDKDDDDKFLGGSTTNGGDELRGMGRIEGSALALVSAGWSPNRWFGMSLALEEPLSRRENGRAYHIGFTSTVYAGERNDITLNLAGHGGDRDYLQTYYGVTAQQSQTSGFRVHSPKAGLYAISTGVDWTYRINEHWGILASVSAERLSGDAGRSPIVESRTAPSALVLATYRF